MFCKLGFGTGTDRQYWRGGNKKEGGIKRQEAGRLILHGKNGFW